MEISQSCLNDRLNAMMHRLRVKIQLRDVILGGVPKHGSPLDYYLSSKQMSDQEKSDFTARTKSGDLTDQEKEEVKSVSWCQFERDHNGHLCLWNGNFKAALREIFVTTGLTQKRPNKSKACEDDERGPSAGGRQTLQHAVSVEPLRPVFLRDGKPLTAPDGYVDRIKHITGPSGSRSAIGRHDYIGNLPSQLPEGDSAKPGRQKSPVTMDMMFVYPKKGVFSTDEFLDALALMQMDGIGSSRSQSFGKFAVLSAELEK